MGTKKNDRKGAGWLLGFSLQPCVLPFLWLCHQLSIKYFLAKKEIVFLLQNTFIFLPTASLRSIYWKLIALH